MRFAAPLIGREDDLRALSSLLDSGERLITIVGPPGIGKTRLAISLLGPRDGIVCDLSSATTVFEICAAVTRALELDPDPGATPARAVAAVGDAIDARGPTTLVLDNFEQVAHLSRETVARWLDAAPEARLLVTSRERLGLDGERVHDLRPLAVPAEGEPIRSAPAVRLLEDRVSRLGRGVAWSAEDDATIGAIVRALDGIPLAIELAAPRLVALGAPELLVRLGDRFELLRATGRGHADRHATLQTAIESSWRMLAPAERDAFAQHAVFRGGFTMEDAERVIVLSGSVLDVVSRLVDRSLLILRAPVAPGQPPRYDSYLSIRELAESKLEGSGGAAAARRRHAEHYVERAEAIARGLDGMQAGTARADFERERDNLLAAVRWTLTSSAEAPDLAARGLLALHAHAVNVGPLREHMPLLDRGVEMLAEHPALLARLLDARGYARLRIGEVDDGIADLEGGAELARVASDAVTEASVLRSIGVGRVKQNRFDEAHRCFEQAAAIARSAGDRRLEGIATGGLGVVRLLVGDLGQAKEILGCALAIHEEVGNAKYQGVVHGNLADVHLELGELDAALHHYERALALNRAAGNRFSEAWAQGSIAVVHHERGELERALALYEQAIAMAEHAGESQYEAMFAGYAGAIALERGELASAERVLERAVRGSEALGDVAHAALFRSYVGVLHAIRGEVDEADRTLASVLESATDRLRPVVCAQRAHVDLARARCASGNDAARYERLAAERALVLSLPAEDGHTPIAVSVDARLALRLLRAHGLPPPMDDSTASLSVTADGGWFELPSSAPVDVTKHRAASRVLSALVRGRLADPGAPITAEALIDAGWPGERIRSGPAKNRLHVALSTLRKLGLAEAVVSAAGGYLLDPSLPLRIVRSPDIVTD